MSAVGGLGVVRDVRTDQPEREDFGTNVIAAMREAVGHHVHGHGHYRVVSGYDHLVVQVTE